MKCDICGKDMLRVERECPVIYSPEDSFVCFQVYMVCSCGNGIYTGQEKKLKILKPD